jgi:hypothetical protein
MDSALKGIQHINRRWTLIDADKNDDSFRVHLRSSAVPYGIQLTLQR